MATLRNLSSPSLSRRSFLRRSGALGLGFLGGQLPFAARPALAMGAGADGYGPLQAPDANGLMLPPGFTSRVVARAVEAPVSGGSHLWHTRPDGGATYATPGGGWIYVSNSETGGGGGGVSALEFDAAGNAVDAYAILSGTSVNCAGGPTPWGTWLSCEEIPLGHVFECDPFAASQGSVRTALGSFKHEAAAVDPVHQHVYLTEDELDGRLYRFTPSMYPDLGAGLLEAAEILDPLLQGPIAPGQVRPLTWHTIPTPNPVFGTPTRQQVSATTAFAGGEGCWYEGGLVYFTTKFDHRVWRLDTAADTVEIVYELASTSTPWLSSPDNVYVSPSGDVFVAEDPGNLEIVALTLGGDVKPIMRITGQTGTEVTGPALSPDGTRLYFSSQRAPVTAGNLGITYEVEGPFLGVSSVAALPVVAQLALVGALSVAARFGSRS